MRSLPTATKSPARHHLTMAAIGFFGGLIVIVPTVYWLAGGGMSQADHSRLAVKPTVSQGADAGRQPVVSKADVLSVPRLVDRASEQPDKIEAAERPASDVEKNSAPGPAREEDKKRPGMDLIEIARGMIRRGEITEAREKLGHPDVAAIGEAQFMLAETFDPNVLAALGIIGVEADPAAARRLYAAAREQGLKSAERRLDALK